MAQVHTRHAQSGAASKKPITPNDDADIPNAPTRGLSVETAGNYALILANDADEDDDAIYLAAGVVHPLRVRRVKETGSDATTGIVGFW